MPLTYVCYLHKSGGPTPDLRFVVGELEQDLPDQILAELSMWRPFDRIDVHDERDRRIFSVTAKPSARLR